MEPIAAFHLRPNKIRHYVDLMTARGNDADTILHSSGLTLASLSQLNSTVTIDQYTQVVANMLRASNNPALGLELGSGASLTDYGELSMAMMAAGNLREAASDWPKLANLFGMFISYQLVDGDSSWSVTNLNTFTLSGDVLRFALEEFYLVLIRFAEALAGEKAVIEAAHFPFPPPDYQQCYSEYLGITPVFNAEKASLKVRSPRLNHPIRSASPELHAIIHNRCSELIKQAQNQGSVVSRLKNLCLARPGNFPSQEEAADFLMLSGRSLRRKLQDENTSFKQLAEAIKLELAEHYLQFEGLSPKEASYLLGYTNVSAFRRSFRAWTGKSISEYLANTDAQ